MGRQVRLTAQAERASVAYSTQVLRSYTVVLDQHVDSDLVSICGPVQKLAETFVLMSPRKRPASCTLGQDSVYCMSAPRSVRTQQFGYSLITVKGDVVLAGVQIRTPTFAHSSQHNQRPEGSSRWKASYQLGQPDRWQKLGRQWAFPR